MQHKAHAAAARRSDAEQGSEGGSDADGGAASGDDDDGDEDDTGYGEAGLSWEAVMAQVMSAVRSCSVLLHRSACMRFC